MRYNRMTGLYLSGRGPQYVRQTGVRFLLAPSSSGVTASVHYDRRTFRCLIGVGDSLPLTATTLTTCAWSGLDPTDHFPCNQGHSRSRKRTPLTNRQAVSPALPQKAYSSVRIEQEASNAGRGYFNPPPPQSPLSAGDTSRSWVQLPVRLL